ncbi:MAG: hypothetical protein QM762_14570 [Chryseolinea sp.]
MTICDIHGPIGINMACRHVIDNIEKGVDEGCYVVRVRVLPGNNTPDVGKEHEHILNNMAFCVRCYENKHMSDKMKVVDDIDSLSNALTDYEIGYGCALCIERYGEENRVN